MANPRKFSEKIALHNQKQAEETAAFEKIMREVSDATNKPEETTLATQYGIGGPRSGGTSPSRAPVQRGRTSSSVGPMRNRPAERKHDTSPYGSTVYLSPPPDSSWRRTNSDSALHQSCNDQPPSPSLSPHHTFTQHSHSHPHHGSHHMRRANDIHLDELVTLGVHTNNRPRSSCEIPRISNNTNVYETGGVDSGGGGLSCGDLQVPGGSLPDLTSVHYPAPHPAHPSHPAHNPHMMHRGHPRASPPNYHHQSPTSPGAVSPGAGSISPATGGLSPASGSPVGATVPVLGPMDALHAALRHDNSPGLYDAQNHLSVPNTNNYPHHSKNMSPLDHTWISASYQSHCSPPSQYSSTSNINIPSPTMVHSPGSPVGSPQTDYSNLHQALLQPFEQITMLDQPPSSYNNATSYNTTYINHSSPVSPQPTSSPQTYSQQATHRSTSSMNNGQCRAEPRVERDPVPGGAPVFAPMPRLTSPSTPPSIPDIILTDYSADLDAGIFGAEEAQLRAGLDLDELTLLEEPSSLLPDSAVEHEFRLDRL